MNTFVHILSSRTELKVLYLECNMGNAGDMMMSALSELIPDPDRFISKLNSLELPSVHVHRSRAIKAGISGTKIDVLINDKEELSEDVHISEHGHKHDNTHTHSNHDHVNMLSITNMIDGLDVSDFVKKNAKAVYKIIAEAESKVHQSTVNEVHFHEVGTMDAIMDIVGVCMLMEEISPNLILSSPINVGKGYVKCAHGILPIPAPATVNILKGMPMYNSDIEGELCTPTGAALIKHFAGSFGKMPVMTVKEIGYGLGKKDFSVCNCVRAFLGEIETGETNEEVVELIANIDDMVGEAIGFAVDVLFENGALDVFNVPVQMKKNRPGNMLVCICRTNDADKMAKLILKHTTTFGVRKKICERYILSRDSTKFRTKYGDVRIKTGFGYGITKSKFEYEDMAFIAKNNRIPLSQVYEEIEREWDKN